MERNCSENNDSRCIYEFNLTHEVRGAICPMCVYINHQFIKLECFQEKRLLTHLSQILSALVISFFLLIQGTEVDGPDAGFICPASDGILRGPKKRMNDDHI